MMEHYSEICKAVGLQPNSKFKVGQTLTRFFDQMDLKQMKQGQEDMMYKYIGLKLHPYSERMAQPLGTATFPLNWITGLDKEHYIINIPTQLAVNREPFDIVFWLQHKTTSSSTVIE